MLQDYQKSKAFLYLAEIKGRFLAVYGQDVQTALPYAMNTDFARTLASTMVRYIDALEISLYKCNQVLDK